MPRRPRSAPALVRLVALAALLLLVPVTGTASAAKRQVPFGFFGSVVDPALALQESDATVEAQYALMARNGVETIRTNFYWSEANPAPGVYDWRITDRIMGAAARYGLDVLPIVQFTPTWASSNPGENASTHPPSDYGTFGTFMGAVVRRYGSTGSFWTERPDLRRNPVRGWQIWNEPAAGYNWRVKDWAAAYVRLLKTAHGAIKAADRRAKVVPAGVVGLSDDSTPWGQLQEFYRLGARRYMDVVAVNSFTDALHGETAKAAVDRNVLITDRVRNVMRRYGDARKRMYITELTWSSGLGRLAKDDRLNYETTPSGQAQRLATYYRRAARDKRLRIARVYWYTWFSSYQPKSLFGIAPSFQYTGLVSHREAGTPFVRKPLLTAYANVAARLQGCRKGANARVCR